MAGAMKSQGISLCALVDELVKGMLAVRARLSPYDRPGLIRGLPAFSVNTFAIALHISLLEVRREPVHVLVIRQDRMGLCSKEIVIPNAEQGKDDRDVPVERRFPEVPVHGMRAFKQFPEMIKAYRAGNRKPDG